MEQPKLTLNIRQSTSDAGDRVAAATKRLENVYDKKPTEGNDVE